jgi:hypothetical protein
MPRDTFPEMVNAPGTYSPSAARLSRLSLLSILSLIRAAALARMDFSRLPVLDVANLHVCSLVDHGAEISSTERKGRIFNLTGVDHIVDSRFPKKSLS